MRTLVMIRKNWGGNRTETGARAQAILTSVLCTARQQDKDVFQLLVDLLRTPQPKVLDILPPEFLSASDLAAGNAKNTSGSTTEAHSKPSEHRETIPFPLCMDTLLTQQQQSAVVPIFSSG